MRMDDGDNRNDKKIRLLLGHTGALMGPGDACNCGWGWGLRKFTGDGECVGFGGFTGDGDGVDGFTGAIPTTRKKSAILSGSVEMASMRALLLSASAAAILSRTIESSREYWPYWPQPNFGMVKRCETYLALT